MTKYVTEVVDIFSKLDVDQISVLALNLNIDEIKVLLSEVVPKIESSDSRKLASSLLIACEKNLEISSTQGKVVTRSLDHRH